MFIRQATPLDAEGIKYVHVQAYQISYRGYIPDSYLDSLTVDEDVIKRTQAFLEKTESWVVEQDNKIIGFAYISYPSQTDFEIMALYVLPSCHQQGVGSTLFRFLCRNKKEAGFQKCIAYTMKDGPSRGFYEKMGCQQRPTEIKMWKFDIPLVLYEKTL